MWKMGFIACVYMGTDACTYTLIYRKPTRHYTETGEWWFARYIHAYTKNADTYTI